MQARIVELIDKVANEEVTSMWLFIASGCNIYLAKECGIMENQKPFKLNFEFLLMLIVSYPTSPNVLPQNPKIILSLSAHFEACCGFCLTV